MSDKTGDIRDFRLVGRAIEEAMKRELKKSKREGRKESAYYGIIKEKMEGLFKEKTTDVYLEITATRKLSTKLKKEFSPHRDIIFYFLKEAAPDITGFIKRENSSDFVVIEIKRKIKLDDVYQTKKYADLFDTKFAFLVTLEPIPEEIKRLSKVVHTLLMRPSIYSAFTLVQFDEQCNEFVDWFEKNPFTKSIYWR